MTAHRIVFALIVGVIFISPTFAQRKPSEATRPFLVMSSQSLDDLQKTLQPDNKTSELIDSAGMQLRVAVQHEKNKTGAAAELHDASDDVYYVLNGSATLVLGGKLDSPKSGAVGGSLMARPLRSRKAISSSCRAERRISAALRIKTSP